MTDQAIGGAAVEIYADSVRVDGPHGPLLRDTSVRVADGEVVLVAGEPGAGHTALALVLSGRLEPSSGDVLLDNALNPSGLRAVVAPVDVPGVSAPEPGLVLAHVVAEELAMAHESPRRSAVKRWLEIRDAESYVDREIGMLPASTRIRILTDLAAARREVRALVLACPDRHGGRSAFWWHIAQAYAAEGFAVVVLCTESSARELGVEPVHLGRPESAAAPPAYAHGVDQIHRVEPTAQSPDADGTHAPEEPTADQPAPAEEGVGEPTREPALAMRTRNNRRRAGRTTIASGGA